MEIPLFKKEHFNLINQLASEQKPFVIYRMPGENESHIFIPSHIETLHTPIHLSASEGFLFVPFNEDQPAVYFTQPISPEKLSALQNKEITTDDLPGETNKETYVKLVNQAIDYMHAGKAKKIVVSGVFRQTWGGPMHSSQLFENLCNLYPEAYCYLSMIPGYGLWAGASPETLIQWENGILQTMALAGTLPQNSQLEWGIKEAQEHNWVVTYIDETLYKEIGHKAIINGPEEITAGKARHLCTRFRTECSNLQALRTAFALHPTPAVGGVPREETKHFILENEPHARELYTGFAGLISNQQVHLFVNLRCAKLGTTEACIFAGGGITPSSNAEDEWNEINLKKGTLSAALSMTLAPIQTKNP
ncbi:MAG: hypothetical protein HPY80_02020 [Bacteroidales bacterium]|nr:hypothetical protein [Bacteroidales bacterium]NPV35427.1 hypothetical protein [Bacteroidales bacterium]